MSSGIFPIREKDKPLEEIEDQYRSLFESSLDGILFLDPDGRIFAANPAACRMLGRTEEEICTAGRDGIVDPADTRLLIAIDERTRAGRFKGELIHRRKDGTRFPAEVTTSVFEYRDGRKQTCVIVRDITERKRMQQELERYSKHLEEMVDERTKNLADSERRFREMTDLLPETVFELNMSGNFTFMNPAGLKASGYDADDLKRGLSAFQVVAPEDHDALRESMKRILNGGPSVGHEFTIMRKDGSRFPEIAYATPIMKEGKVIGLRGVVVDITERKRLEERLLRSERLAAIGETAAMVAHDLRSPLQGITMAAYLLKQNCGPNQETIELLGLIENALNHADKIVKELLDYSRETHLQLAESTARIVLDTALQQIKKPVTVTIENLTENTPSMLLDASKIQRVFTNLIMNAIEAMPNGGKLTISSKESQGELQVKFADTGEGISEKAMQTLWKPMKTTKPGGTGLGLVICKGIVEVHGGSIQVETTVGKGSTFTVKLPIKHVSSTEHDNL